MTFSFPVGRHAQKVLNDVERLSGFFATLPTGEDFVFSPAIYRQFSLLESRFCESIRGRNGPAGHHSSR